MSDDEKVGSVAEEAAKLLGAIQDWAKENGSDYAQAAAGLADGARSSMGSLNEHIATGAEECRYCPVCQVISAVRRTSPEFKAHLAAAGISLMQAVEELMATRPTSGHGKSHNGPVERIDLAGADGEWDEDWD